MPSTASFTAKKRRQRLSAVMPKTSPTPTSQSSNVTLMRGLPSHPTPAPSWPISACHVHGGRRRCAPSGASPVPSSLRIQSCSPTTSTIPSHRSRTRGGTPWVTEGAWCWSRLPRDIAHFSRRRSARGVTSGGICMTASCRQTARCAALTVSSSRRAVRSARAYWTCSSNL